MARPIKNNADYFTHDSDMRNDPKVKALRKKYSFKGYAIWCYLLEELTNSEDFEIVWNDLNIELLSGDFDCETTDLIEVVEYCIKVKLLEIADEKLFCSELLRRFESLLSKRKRDRNKVIDVDNSPSNTDNPQSKVEYSKLEYSKEITFLYDSVVIFFDENCRPKTDKEKFKWYDDLDKLIRIDNKEPDKIKQVIKKARMDDFWCKNFMSVLKLRKKNKEGIPYFIVFENKFFGKEVKNNIPQFFSGPKK